MPAPHTLVDKLQTFARYHLKRRVVDYPAPETELDLVPLDLDLDALVSELHQRRDRYDLDVLERVRYQDREHEILRLRSRCADPRATLMLLVGVHGNEHAGLLALPDILDAHDDARVRLVVVAPVNPVGAAELSRYNAQGYDINRDFVRFDTPEARAVRRAVDEDRPDFVLSLHEGPQDATFVFSNRLVSPQLAARLVEALARGGTTLASHDYFGRRLEPAGHSPVAGQMYLLSLLWAKLLHMETSALWCEQRGIPELTLESSWRQRDRAARLRPHVDLVRAIVAELATS
ncbi:MAG: DUF2817 domain-containing protein [Pseudomonadota bacterium]